MIYQSDAEEAYTLSDNAMEKGLGLDLGLGVSILGSQVHGYVLGSGLYCSEG